MPNTKSISVILALTLLFAGCGIFEKDEPPVYTAMTPPTPKVEKPQIPLEDKVCESMGAREENHIYQEDEVVIKRHYQQVRRFGCKDGVPSRDVIESFEWEEVVSPKIDYIITAQTIKEPSVLNDPLDQWDNGLFNNSVSRHDCKRTGKAPISILFGGPTGYDKNQIGMTLDLSPTVFNTRALPGVNYLDYEFVQFKESPTCTSFEQRNSAACEESNVVLERGTVILNVIYELKTEGKILEIIEKEKSEFKCKKEQEEALAKAQEQAPNNN